MHSRCHHLSFSDELQLMLSAVASVSVNHFFNIHYPSFPSSVATTLPYHYSQLCFSRRYNLFSLVHSILRQCSQVNLVAWQSIIPLECCLATELVYLHIITNILKYNYQHSSVLMKGLLLLIQYQWFKSSHRSHCCGLSPNLVIHALKKRFFISLICNGR